MIKEKMPTRKIDIDDIDITNTDVDYYDGDIAIFDNIKDMTNIGPLYTKMNIVILCNNGNIQFDINDRTLTLHQGELMICTPNIMLDNYIVSFNFECKILCLSTSVINALLREKIEQLNNYIYSRKTNVLQLPYEDKEQFLYYYGLIKYKMEHKKRTNQHLIMHSIIRAMLLDVCCLFDDYISDDHVRVSHMNVLFRKFLNMLSNSPIKRIPVEKYASSLSITPKYLSYICSVCSDKTPSEWIGQYMQEDIRYNLCYTDLSIKEISIKLGFNNISHFGTYVRKHFGISPKLVRLIGRE